MPSRSISGAHRSRSAYSWRCSLASRHSRPAARAQQQRRLRARESARAVVANTPMPLLPTREALASDPADLPALLGLERMDAQLGHLEQFLPMLERAIAAKPQLAPLREAQLRTLRTLGRREQLRAAFERWRADVPDDPTPAREYSRLLIADGDTQRRRQRPAPGAEGPRHGTRASSTSSRSYAQPPACGISRAQSWREAVEENAYLDQAATFSLDLRARRRAPGNRADAPGSARRRCPRGACSRRFSSCGERRATDGSRCACCRPTAPRWSRGGTSRRRRRRWRRGSSRATRSPRRSTRVPSRARSHARRTTRCAAATPPARSSSRHSASARSIPRPRRRRSCPCTCARSASRDTWPMRRR